jgi:hypothetical protein
LIVKLPLADRSKGGKKKNKRALARAHGALFKAHERRKGEALQEVACKIKE